MMETKTKLAVCVLLFLISIISAFFIDLENGTLTFLLGLSWFILIAFCSYYYGAVKYFNYSPDRVK